jgi:hypothetical protein
VRWKSGPPRLEETLGDGGWTLRRLFSCPAAEAYSAFS